MLRLSSILALSFLTLALFSSCDKFKKTGTVELQFRAYYDGQPLVMLEEYGYNDTLDILFQRFNFYISDMAAIPSEGNQEAKLVDIDFVDFDAVDNLAKAEEGYVIKIEKVRADDFKSVFIGLGIPADLNATKESDYPDSHPLGKESHYWTAWESYIFSMINGKVDTDGDGVFDDSSVLYHCGSDAVYRSKTIDHEFTVKGGETTRITFAVDLHKLFREGEGYMDIIAIPATHTLDNLPQAIKVMDNFIEVLEIEE